MTDWSKYALENLTTKGRINAIRATLSPKEREEFDAKVGRMDTGRSSLGQTQREVELVMRRKWAAKIREKFDKYHIEPHSSSEECGACGAIAGTNFMDPDYVGDGPEGERP